MGADMEDNINNKKIYFSIGFAKYHLKKNYHLLFENLCNRTTFVEQENGD